MDAVGNSVVVWQSRTRYPYGVYGQLYDLNGNPVGGEFRVNFYEYSASSEYPSVAMNESGNFVATWTGDGPMGTGVYGRSYDNHGNPLTGRIRLDSSYLVVQQDYASVGIDRNGNFVAIWRSRNPDSGWGFTGDVLITVAIQSVTNLK